MPKNIKKLLGKNGMLNKEEVQQLWDANEYGDTIKTANIDALVIANKKDLKVYTEKTADKVYRILVERINEGAVILNEDGTILYCNLSFANMVMLPLEKVIGTTFKNFVDNPAKRRFDDLLKKGIGNAIKEEIYIYPKAGIAMPVLMSVNSFSLDNIFVVSIILTDLTIQNRNQEELKLRTKELEQKNTQLASQNIEKEKRTRELIILSEDLRVQQDELKRAHDEILALNKNLEQRVIDRTFELQNLNHELNDLNLSKDKFLSVISHDLRNPLTALLMASDALSQDTDDPIFNKVQPFIKVIHRTSNNILRQLNELLDWAKMQQKKAILNPKKLHLVLAVNESLELLRANALQKNIVLENRIPFDISVNGDILMFRSIIQNIVTNAIKYTSQNGLITITAQRKNKMVEISITDSGIGMEANIRDNLFSNSDAASVAGTNNEQGSGLGLVLVKDFVAQHGGTIKAESELGKGSCIIFTLPEYTSGEPER